MICPLCMQECGALIRDRELGTCCVRCRDNYARGLATPERRFRPCPLCGASLSWKDVSFLENPMTSAELVCGCGFSFKQQGITDTPEDRAEFLTNANRRWLS